MIKHLFKLVWNRKHSNFLMITEIFFSFLVLFGVTSLLLYFWQNYTKPMGFDTERIWYINVDWHETPDEVVRPSLEQLVKHLESLPEIENVALASGNPAYTNWSSIVQLEHNNQQFQVSAMTLQHGNFQDVFGLKLTEGRWFREADAFSNRSPVIITQDLERKIFGNASAVGKTLSQSDNRKLVVGVVEAFRTAGELHEDMGTMFAPSSLADTSAWVQTTLYVRLAPGATPAFEEKFVKEATAIGKGWIFNVWHLDNMRINYFTTFLTPTLAFVLIAAFLVLNVALGIFGVLWYNINKRYPEIGLRRALGARASAIYSQFLGEVMIIATLGLALGSFFAIQFPLLGIFNVLPDVYLSAIGIAAFLIYALVVLCAVYPSRQAAAIHPAIALHEE